MIRRQLKKEHEEKYGKTLPRVKDKKLKEGHGQMKF